MGGRRPAAPTDPDGDPDGDALAAVPPEGAAVPAPLAVVLVVPAPLPPVPDRLPAPLLVPRAAVVDVLEASAAVVLVLVLVSPVVVVDSPDVAPLPRFEAAAVVAAEPVHPNVARPKDSTTMPLAIGVRAACSSRPESRCATRR